MSLLRGSGPFRRVLCIPQSQRISAEGGQSHRVTGLFVAEGEGSVHLPTQGTLHSLHSEIAH